ncbi:MAG: glycosyltransferase family 4 protein [Acidobacteria bacterium]|jgi:glycosyltransferase involved in cell wall biosynthesis|nr:glycosyltransferase family 4 protein [Acidobacteriota bacterium]
MTPKLRVLVFSGCYLPGFRAGGPISSLVNLVKALGAEVDFRIVTLDTDVGSHTPYATVTSGVWQTVDGTEVLYLSRGAVSIRRLAGEIDRHAPQLMYLNGFFEPVFTIRLMVARRLGMIPRIPILLAPRGDCSPGALSLKRAKKSVYISCARLAGLYRDLSWHASSALERQDIMRVMTAVPAERIHVAPVLTAETTAAPSRPPAPADGALRVCFLSRISPIKNLDFALRVLASVQAPVVFTIYGPIEDAGYWAACEALVARLPEHIRAVYAGEVPSADVRGTLARHDLLFLPSRGESFGHVIHEALSAGVPVLTSDQTPWTDLDQHGAGWSLPLHSMAAFAHTIDAVSRRSPQERDAAAARATAYAAQRADRPAAIRRTYELLSRVAGT